MLWHADAPNQLAFPFAKTCFSQGAEREDCFDETEGLEFLASEVGLEPGELGAEGAEIAALVGYQKVRARRRAGYCSRDGRIL